MFAGFARWIGFLTMTACVVGALLLSVGFFWFAWNIPTEVTWNAPLRNSQLS